MARPDPPRKARTKPARRPPFSPPQGIDVGDVLVAFGQPAHLGRIIGIMRLHLQLVTCGVHRVLKIAPADDIDACFPNFSTRELARLGAYRLDRDEGLPVHPERSPRNIDGVGRRPPEGGDEAAPVLDVVQRAYDNHQIIWAVRDGALEGWPDLPARKYFVAEFPAPLVIDDVEAKKVSGAAQCLGDGKKIIAVSASDVQDGDGPSRPG